MMARVLVSGQPLIGLAFLLLCFSTKDIMLQYMKSDGMRCGPRRWLIMQSVITHLA